MSALWTDHLDSGGRVVAHQGHGLLAGIRIERNADGDWWIVDSRLRRPRAIGPYICARVAMQRAPAFAGSAE